MICYPRVPLNHQLGVLAFTPVYLSFLNILVDYDPYSTLSILITICTFIPLRFLPLDRCDNLFNKVIMLFLLISRILIYIFFFICIAFTFDILFDNTDLIIGRFYHLGWLQATGFSSQATYFSPSGYVLFGKDHLLCQWTCTTLPVVLFHSECHLKCLPFSHSFLSLHLSLPVLHQL